MRFSRKPCPSCGGPMTYIPTLLTWLLRLQHHQGFGRYKRRCLTRNCGYTDPQKVKIYKREAI